MGEKYAWASPEVIGHMTLAQLKMYLEVDNTDSPGMQQRPANAFGGKAERDAWAAKRREEKGRD